MIEQMTREPLAMRVTFDRRSCLRLLRWHEAEPGQLVDVKDGNRKTRERLGRLIVDMGEYRIYAIGPRYLDW